MNFFRFQICSIESKYFTGFVIFKKKHFFILLKLILNELCYYDFEKKNKTEKMRQKKNKRN